MFFDVAFRKADQVWGVDQSDLFRLFFRKGQKGKDLHHMSDSTKQSRPVNLSNLFDIFIREREMLYGARPATIRFYRKGWVAFERRGLPTTLETIVSFQCACTAIGASPPNAHKKQRFLNEGFF